MYLIEAQAVDINDTIHLCLKRDCGDPSPLRYHVARSVTFQRYDFAVEG